MLLGSNDIRPSGLNTHINMRIKPYNIKSTAPPVPPRYILEYSDMGISIDAPINGPHTFPMPPSTVISKTIIDVSIVKTLAGSIIRMY